MPTHCRHKRKSATEHCRICIEREIVRAQARLCSRCTLDAPGPRCLRCTALLVNKEEKRACPVCTSGAVGPCCAACALKGAIRGKAQRCCLVHRTGEPTDICAYCIQQAQSQWTNKLSKNVTCPGCNPGSWGAYCVQCAVNSANQRWKNLCPLCTSGAMGPLCIGHIGPLCDLLSDYSRRGLRRCMV